MAVTGVTAVVAGLRRIAARLGDLSPVGESAGSELVETAAKLAPVDTGRLVNSIRADAGRAGFFVIAGEGLEYAGVQNTGWPARNIEGTGYMDRAREQAERVTARETESTLDQLVRAVGLA